MIFDEIIYGTQYYRAPTPLESEWEKDIVKMNSLNIDVFQIRVQWRQNEVSEGIYNFDDVDKLFELAKKYRKRVVFKFLLETAPQYIFDKYEGTRINFDGTPILPCSHGAFYVGGWIPCFDNPKVIERAKLFVEECVKRYMSKEELILWHVWNEPRSRPAGDCCCKYSKELWHKWLEKQYGTVDALNDMFGVREESFETIPLPGGPHGYWDFFLFRKWRSSEALADRLSFVYDSIRKYDKDRPIMCHVGVSSGIQFEFNDNSDDYTLSKTVDFYGTSLPVDVHADEFTRPFCGLVCDYLRGVDKNFFVHELYSDWGEWRKPASRQDLRFKVWTLISHGAKGLMYWQMRAERLGLENNVSGFLEMDGSDKVVTKEVEMIGEVLHKNMNIFKAATPLKADIVFVYDYDSSLMSQIEDHDQTLHVFKEKTDALNYYYETNVGMYNLFYDLGYAVDYVDSRDVEKILDYKVAYIPYGCMFKKECEDILVKFVENGGLLLLDEGFGLRRENTWLATNKLPYDKLLDASWHYRVKDSNNENEKLPLMDTTVTVKPFRTNYEINSSKALACYDDGKPAISLIEKGKGNIIVFGTSIGYSYGMFKEDGWKTFVERLLETVGCNVRKLPFTKDGLTSYICEGQDCQLVYIFNWSGEQQIIDIQYDKELLGIVKQNDKGVILQHGDVAILLTKDCYAN